MKTILPFCTYKTQQFQRRLARHAVQAFHNIAVANEVREQFIHDAHIDDEGQRLAYTLDEYNENHDTDNDGSYGMSVMGFDYQDPDETRYETFDNVAYLAQAAVYGSAPIDWAAVYDTTINPALDGALHHQRVLEHVEKTYGVTVNRAAHKAPAVLHSELRDTTLMHLFECTTQQRLSDLLLLSAAQTSDLHARYITHLEQSRGFLLRNALTSSSSTLRLARSISELRDFTAHYALTLNTRTR